MRRGVQASAAEAAPRPECSITAGFHNQSTIIQIPRRGLQKGSPFIMPLVSLVAVVRATLPRGDSENPLVCD